MCRLDLVRRGRPPPPPTEYVVPGCIFGNALPGILWRLDRLRRGTAQFPSPHIHHKQVYYRSWKLGAQIFPCSASSLLLLAMSVPSSGLSYRWFLFWLSKWDDARPTIKLGLLECRAEEHVYKSTTSSSSISIPQQSGHSLFQYTLYFFTKYSPSRISILLVSDRFLLTIFHHKSKSSTSKTSKPTSTSSP